MDENVTITCERCGKEHECVRPALPAPEPSPETVEVCPNDGTVAHFKCSKCEKEWYTHKASMAHSNQRFAPEVLALRARVADLESGAALPAPEPPDGVTLKTSVAISVSPERWNALQEELLTWKSRTLAALQHLRGFTGIRDLDEIQAILDDDERRWEEIKSGISVRVSEGDKDWMVPLAHGKGLTLGGWIQLTFDAAAIAQRVPEDGAALPAEHAPPAHRKADL